MKKCSSPWHPEERSLRRRVPLCRVRDASGNERPQHDIDLTPHARHAPPHPPAPGLATEYPHYF